MTETVAATRTCQRPDCGGPIDTHGYCGRCGFRATAPPARRAPLPEPSARLASSGRTGAGILGSGLADLPPVPGGNPAEAVLADPSVPERDRFCRTCRHPVGRSRDGRPGVTSGFCPRDRTPFSFVPALPAGELVAGQYEVYGALAHGGLGWIYLAADRNLDGRWVVLKGLIDTTDPDAIAAAEAERRFLTAVDHPTIVKVLNFVRHRQPATGARHGYLVMEYVAGTSLHDLLRQRQRQHRTPLPLRQAIPYALEVLRAFDYLHRQGMLYCDLKPENLIQVEDRLKVIDLGAVRLADDEHGDIWGTTGYQAPEVATAGPSVRSDLYTVGRTLAVLGLGLRPVTGGPDGPREAPLPELAPFANDSLLRFLHRACAADPTDRFATAAEMAEQLTGVLREIRAAEDGVPYPAPSSRFGPERGAAGTELAVHDRGPLERLRPAEAVAALPVPLSDPDDPAATALAGLAGNDPDELLTLVEALPDTPATRLTRLRVLVEGRHPEAAAALADADRELPGDWRVAWYHAVHALATGDPQEALRRFDPCVSWLPGEPAPKLALAFSMECHHWRSAASWYESVWRTDHGYLSAVFGLARTGPDLGVLDQVPAGSSHYLAAQQALVVAATVDKSLDGVRLTAAGERLSKLDRLAPAPRAVLAVELLEAARDLIAAGGADPRRTILGAPLTATGIGEVLARRYRELAAAAGDRELRRLYVDRANLVRPRTWL